jgi:CRP/FNR family transcriptional regulator
MNLQDDETLVYLKSFARKRTLSANEILFYAGEEPKNFLLLSNGEIEIYKNDAKGNEIIIGQFQAPSLVAEMATLEQIAYPATARCRSSVEVYEIGLDSMESYIYQNSSPLARMMIGSLTKKIQHLKSVLKYTTITNATVRAASFLLDNEYQLPQLTQRKIASNIMLTPEGLSRILKRFKDGGILKVDSKKLYIVNRDKLLEIVG